MSADSVTTILDRAMREAGFRELLAADPESALAEYDLTADERARFTSGTAHTERLEERISKTDLSAMVGTKTSSPNLKPPSEGKPPR